MTPLPALTTQAAPGSGSTPSGNATRTAAAAALAASPDGAQKAELALTPGLEQLDAEQIAKAFMGETVEVKDTKRKEVTNETDETTETETDEETEEAESTEETENADEAEQETTEETEEAETTEETESEEHASDLEKGLDKAKLSPGLRKRFKELLKENPKLKSELETLKQQLDAKRAEPEVVTAPTASNLFNQARNVAEVEQQAAAVIDDAEDKLDWLDTHRDGGTYGSGENAVELTPEQVAQYRTHYRKVLRSVEGHKAARLDYLKRYAETVKEIGADKVMELVKPAVETRESRFAKHVMQEPDFVEFLADARAGREQREKLKQGIKFVEVKPGAKTPVKPSGEKPAVNGSKPVTRKVAEEKPKADRSPAHLDKLRARAAAGDAAAQEELSEWFMAKA